MTTYNNRSRYSMHHHHTCNADNCSVPGHTSLNCWNKYVSLNAGEPGDLVESYGIWRSTRSADWGRDLTGSWWSS